MELEEHSFILDETVIPPLALIVVSRVALVSMIPRRYAR